MSSQLIQVFRGRKIAKAVGNRRFPLIKEIGKALANTGKLLGPVLRFLGFTVGGFFQNLFQFLVQSSIAIYHFNWRITDEQIDANAQAALDGLGSMLGGTLGNATGWLVCGFLPGAVVATFNPALGAYILKNVGEEALEEFAGNVTALIRYSISASTRIAVLNAYKQGRRAFFANDNAFTREIAAFLDIDYDREKALWLSGTGEPYTFAQEFEERIENIDNGFLRNFREGFIEEFFEGCLEAGYVVAYSLDSWIATQKLTNQAVLGEERVVEVQPNREAQESIVLAGPENLVRGQVVQTLATYQLLRDRDVGVIAGDKIDDAQVKQQYPIALVLTLSSRQTPPYRDEKRITIKLPNVKRTALDWQKIKFAAGGSNGYLWGPWFANALLDDGHYIKVYAATKDEAEDRAKALATLCQADIRTINTTHEIKAAARLIDTRLQKQVTRIYPAKVVIQTRKRRTADQPGRVSPQSNGKQFAWSRRSIDLWPDTKPFDFEQTVQQALEDLDALI